MLEKFSQRLTGALMSGDESIAQDLFALLFELRDTEPSTAMMVDHLGLLPAAPSEDLADFLRDYEDSFVLAYSRTEPLRIGELGHDCQMQSVKYFREIGCTDLMDIAFSRVQTSRWGIDHFERLQAELGDPSSLDFVFKMAIKSASWKGLRSDFIALLGWFLKGAIDNPFERIDKERVEAVIWSIGELKSKLTLDQSREADALRLCRRACRDMSAKDFTSYMLDQGVEQASIIRACPELQDQVFITDLGL